MIIAGTLMLEAPMSAVRLARGWLRVEGDRMAEVAEGDCPHTVDLGGDGAVIMPGLVDAHLHLPQFDSIGADGLTLLKWLEEVIYPAEARWVDADFAGAMTERAIGQLLAAGTTAFAGYSTVHREATAAALEVCRAKGVRAAVGQSLMDQHAPAELTRPADELLADCAAWFSGGATPGACRVEPSVNPRFAVACSLTLMLGAAEVARQHGAMVQTHLAETQKECQAVYDLHDGADYTKLYDRAGLLGERSVLAHGVWLAADARRLLAKRGAIVAHCPTANLFLGSGTMDRTLHRTDGVRLALGSDIAGGPDRSMVRVARAMIEAARSIGRLPPSSAEAWWQITAGNADALGWPTCGRLAAGMEADVLIVQPDLPWRDAPNALSTLLYGWDDRWLTHTIVAGHASPLNTLE